MVSINTNTNQQAALQLLNANARDLDGVQKRLATGLDVASAKDDGAIWGMAVHAKSDLGAYETLGRARDHAIGLNDVTLAATEAVSISWTGSTSLLYRPRTTRCPTAPAPRSISNSRR